MTVFFPSKACVVVWNSAVFRQVRGYSGSFAVDVELIVMKVDLQKCVRKKLDFMLVLVRRFNEAPENEVKWRGGQPLKNRNPFSTTD